MNAQLLSTDVVMFVAVDAQGNTFRFPVLMPWERTPYHVAREVVQEVVKIQNKRGSNLRFKKVWSEDFRYIYRVFNERKSVEPHWQNRVWENHWVGLWHGSHCAADQKYGRFVDLPVHEEDSDEVKALKEYITSLTR